MIHNHIKYNWTLEQLHWNLYPVGNFQLWDGLTNRSIEIVDKDDKLLEDKYVKEWYIASKKVLVINRDKIKTTLLQLLSDCDTTVTFQSER